jgi:microcystin-dependent protein
MAITWTKLWSASDDGTILTGADLKNIQDDVSSGIEGNATSIQDIPVDAPVAGDDDAVLFYDHGNLKFDYASRSTIVSDGLPSGIILLWSGAISAIPTGWVICDGNNSTPDLTDRFVLHADSDSGGTNDVGDTGGASTHTLTESEIPSHQHLDHSLGGSGGNNAFSLVSGRSSTPDLTVSGSAAANTGGGGAHTNRDKYYALAYIMKT